MHSRRKLIQFSTAAVCVVAAPSLVLAQTYSAPTYAQPQSGNRVSAEDAISSVYEPPREFWRQPRFVHLRRVATGQVMRIEFWRDGQLNIEAYRHLCWFLRDLRMESLLARGDPTIEQALRGRRVRQDQLTPWVSMDPILLDILYAYSAWLQYHGIDLPVDITSAFRHFLTNAMIEGAAQNSQHPLGKAADIRVPKVSVQALAAFGRWLAGGGVGLYTNKDFVHVDSGRVRSWRG